MPQTPRARWLLLTFSTYILFALVTLQVPLASDPGYEFAASIAVVTSLVAGISTLFRPHHAVDATERQTSCDSPGRMTLDIIRGMGQQALLAMTPLLVAFPIWALRSACTPGDLLTWFLLLTPPSAIISSSIATLCVSMTQHRWVRVATFMALWIVSLVRGGIEALTGPHIYLYAWQIGYFPGGSWSADQPLPVNLLFYRVVGIIGAVALGLASGAFALTTHFPHSTRPRRKLIALLVMTGVAVFAWISNRDSLGYSSSYEYVETELDDSIRCALATIRFRRASVDSLDLWEATRVVDTALAEYARFLGMNPKRLLGTRVYLYGNAEEQQRMVGPRSLAYTKPWQRAVHMQASEASSALRHELAHVALAPYGFALGIPLSQGMLEGSAVALEGRSEWRTLQQYARSAYDAGLAPSANHIMGIGGFTSLRPQLAYRLAGAFCSWLIRTYGVRRYLEALPTGNFHEVYGVELTILSDRFRHSLDSLPAPDSLELVAARYLFGGGGFFVQRCLRRIGALNARGDRALVEGKYLKAVEYYRESLDEGVSIGARSGLLRARMAMGQWRAVLDSMDHYRQDSTGTAYLGLEIERGDALWCLGDTDSAREHYAMIFRFDVTRSLTLRAALRLCFIDAPPPLRELMRDYFTRPLDVLGRIAVLNAAASGTLDNRQRLLVLLMRAVLTSHRSPIATITGLGRELDDTVSLELRHHGVPLHESFALRELARDLVSAWELTRAHGIPGACFDPHAFVTSSHVRDLPMPSRAATSWP